MLDVAAAQWRTPSDLSKRGGSQAPEKRKAGGHTVNLEDQAGHWATPQARDHFPAHSPYYVAEKKAQGHGMRNLNDEASNWPTPAARDYRSDTAGEKTSDDLYGTKGRPLARFAVHDWPTPLTADDGQKVTARSAQRALMNEAAAWPGQHTRPDQPTSAGRPSSPDGLASRQLNPAFVEWLMGWPTGLSGFDTAATASCRSPLPSPGCACMDCWLTTQRAMLADLLAIDPPKQHTLL